MFRSIQTFSVNGKFTERYQNILCTDRLSFFSFSSAHIIDRYFIILALYCALILGYTVRIFHVIDAKYVMFRVG